MTRLGVTGHRILAELDKIDSGIERALRRIDEAFPGQSLTVISALAEGADRLVAHRVLARPGSMLIVPLPLAPADYLTDFTTRESQTEFRSLLKRAGQVIEMPPTTTRDEAYEAAGNYVLDHSDVLIAVWDGKDAQGRGGTGSIVRRAREMNMPVAWIHAGNRRVGTTEPTSLGDQQGLVSFENFPDI